MQITQVYLRLTTQPTWHLKSLWNGDYIFFFHDLCNSEQVHNIIHEKIFIKTQSLLSKKKVCRRWNYINENQKVKVSVFLEVLILLCLESSSHRKVGEHWIRQCVPECTKCFHSNLHFTLRSALLCLHCLSIRHHYKGLGDLQLLQNYYHTLPRNHKLFYTHFFITYLLTHSCWRHSIHHVFCKCKENTYKIMLK